MNGMVLVVVKSLWTLPLATFGQGTRLESCSNIYIFTSCLSSTPHLKGVESFNYAILTTPIMELKKLLGFRSPQHERLSTATKITIPANLAPTQVTLHPSMIAIAAISFIRFASIVLNLIGALRNMLEGSQNAKSRLLPITQGFIARLQSESHF